MRIEATAKPGTSSDFSNAQRWSYLAILLMITISCYIDRGVLSVLLEPIKHEFTLSDFQLGLMSGPPFALCYVIASIPLARIADRKGRKVVLLWSLIAWSAMTGLCGLAASLTLLVIFRMCVGAAEGGAVPSVHALLASYFPPRRRAIAFAILSVAPSTGVAVAHALGGFMAENYGWRSAFLLMAMLAVPVIALGLVFLKEPRIAVVKAAPEAPPSKFWSEAKVLLRKKTFVYVALGSVMISFFTQGVMVFAPSYMIRSLDMTVAQAGVRYGSAWLTGSICGMVVGGLLANYLSQRGPRALLMMPGCATAMAWLFATGALLSNNATTFLILVTCTSACMTASLPAIHTTDQYVCGDSRRALAGAMHMAAINGLGITFGSVSAGSLSQILSASLGKESLGWAMLCLTPVLLLSSLFMFLATRHVLRDAE